MASPTCLSLIEKEVARLESSDDYHAYAPNYAEGMITAATVTCAITFEQADHFSHRIDVLRRNHSAMREARSPGRYANVN